MAVGGDIVNADERRFGIVANALGVNGDESRARSEPEAAVIVAKSHGGAFVGGLQSGHAFTPFVDDGADAGGASLGDVDDFVFSDFKNAAIAAEPKPAALVIDDLGDVIVAEAL